MKDKKKYWRNTLNWKKKKYFDKLKIEYKSINQKAMKFIIEKEKPQTLKFMISKAQILRELQKLMESSDY